MKLNDEDYQIIFISAFLFIFLESVFYILNGGVIAWKTVAPLFIVCSLIAVLGIRARRRYASWQEFLELNFKKYAIICYFNVLTIFIFDSKTIFKEAPRFVPFFSAVRRCRHCYQTDVFKKRGEH